MKQRLKMKRAHIKSMRALVTFCKIKIREANVALERNPLNRSAANWWNACTNTLRALRNQKRMPHTFRNF